MATHTHTYELRGHVERCTGTDCLAWRPPVSAERDPEPITRPRRLTAAERRARQRWGSTERTKQEAERG